MSKAFVKNLSQHIFKEFQSPLSTDDLKESFKEAVGKLPEGKLQSDLNKNVDKHVQRLEKRLLALCKSQIPDLSTSVDESLGDVTSELDTRGDASEPSKHLHNMLYNLKVNPVVFPKQDDLASLTDQRKISVYCGFLREVFNREDIQFGKIQTAVDHLKALINPDEEGSKNVFGWLPTVHLLQQITVNCQPLAVIRVLKILFDSVVFEMGNCEKKPVRAGKLARIIKMALITAHLRISQKEMSTSDSENYGHVVSGLCNIYIDLCCYNFRKEKSPVTKKQLGNQISGFVSRLLSPEYMIEAVFLLDNLKPKMANIVLPLISKCLSTRPRPKQHEYYLKYILLVRSLKEKIGEDNQLEKEWVVLTQSQVPAGPKFLHWLLEEDPGTAEHLPLEDRHFSKLKVTRFLLEDAGEELIDQFYEILHEEEEFCVPEDEEREEVTSVSKETDDIIRPFEELFFLDKSGASQIVDENMCTGAESRKKEGKKPILLKTLEELAEIVDLDTEGTSTPQGFVLDPILVSEKVRDPEDQKFLESEIISITSIDTSADENAILKSVVSKKANASSPKKKPQKSETKSKTETPNVKELVKSGLEILESGTEYSENESVLMTSEDEHKLKSVVRKVDKKAMKETQPVAGKFLKDSDVDSTFESSVILVEDSEDEVSRELHSEKISKKTERDAESELDEKDDLVMESAGETVSDVHESSIEHVSYEFEPHSDSQSGESSVELDTDDTVMVDEDISKSDDQRDAKSESSPVSGLRRSPRKRKDNSLSETSGSVSNSKTSPINSKSPLSSPVKKTTKESPTKEIDKKGKEDTIDLTESDIEGTVSEQSEIVDTEDTSVGQDSETNVTVKYQELSTSQMISEKDLFMDSTVKYSPKKSVQKVDNAEQKKNEREKKRSETKELCDSDESDKDLHKPSPKKSNKTAIEEKFIGKAIRGQKTPKKQAKQVEKVDNEDENFDNEDPKKNEEDSKRTKSTEEIITIVEDIKGKMKSPRRISKAAREEEPMFTDDSVESVNSSISEETVFTAVKSKESGNKASQIPELQNIVSNRSQKGEHTDDNEPETVAEDKAQKTSDRKTPKKSGSSTPEKSLSESPGKSGSKTPKTSDSKTPKKSDSKTPRKSDSKTPRTSDRKTPKTSGSKTPKTSDSKTPRKSDSKTPRKSNNETSGEPENKSPQKSDRNLTSSAESPTSSETGIEIVTQSPKESSDLPFNRSHAESDTDRNKTKEKLLSPSKSRKEEVIPSSSKKRKTEDGLEFVLETDSNSDVEPVPNLEQHLKSPNKRSMSVSKSEESQNVSKDDETLEETEESPKKTRRSLRPRIVQDLTTTESSKDSDVSMASRTRRTRAGAKTNVPESKAAAAKGQKTKTTSKKDTDVQSETDITDNSDVDGKSLRRSAGMRRTAVKDKNVGSGTDAVPTTPETKRNTRKLSASTSKKVVQKVEALRGTRKRRLSGELSDQTNSTDSEVSFPKLKKVPSANEKRPPRRMSAIQPSSKPEVSTGTARRQSLRKK